METRAGLLGNIIYWPAPDHQILLFCEISRREKFSLQSSVKMGNAPSSQLTHACSPLLGTTRPFWPFRASLFTSRPLLTHTI